MADARKDLQRAGSIIAVACTRFRRECSGPNELARTVEERKLAEIFQDCLIAFDVLYENGESEPERIQARHFRKELTKVIGRAELILRREAREKAPSLLEILDAWSETWGRLDDLLTEIEALSEALLHTEVRNPPAMKQRNQAIVTASVSLSSRCA